MQRLFLIKYGEISLKGRNREAFEKRLLANIKTQLRGLAFSLNRRVGRIYLQPAPGHNQEISQGLKRVFGIVSFSQAIKTGKTMENIQQAALDLAGELIEVTAAFTFKIQVKRTDKSFELNSYQIACRLGDLLRSHFPKLTVDVTHPAWVINVEVREAAYIYGPGQSGLKGLPAGCNGKGLLLLSGGIDSPVAGFLMAKRGLALDAIYFHTHPFTPPQALQKVENITGILSAYLPCLKLFIVDFTDLQLTIRDRSQAKAVTLFSRASMMHIANTIAPALRANCLVTGESLGQVASQTPESLRFTGSFSSLPVLRPLIGMDKEEITVIAKKIGTYELSIQPFADCCTLFAPKHPLIRPDFMSLIEEYKSLNLDDLLKKAAETIEGKEF
jgi:thiamine biosynthesis protein ThiI